MLNIIGIVLGILISSLWIFLPLKRVPEEIRLKKSRYILSIVLGATLCTIVIIILETVWDKLTGIPEGTADTLPQALAVSFTRAALLEEGAKYFFVRSILKKYRPRGRLQYMLLAAAVGMGYGIAEKLVMGSAVAMLSDTLFSMHAMFQFIMGWFLYEAANTQDAAKKRTAAIKAFLVPFVLHGIWDFTFFGATIYIGNGEMTVAGIASVIVILLIMIAGIVGEVKMARYLKRVPPDHDTELRPELS